MKKITLLVSFLFGTLAMNAQEVVYFEDFEGQDLSDWELHDVDGDGLNWGDMFFVPDNNGNPVTPVSLISRSWQQSALTPDNWAITPAIDLTNASGDIQLSWKVTAAAAEWDNEHYSVYVATSKDLNTLANSNVNFSETYDDPNDNGTQYDRSLDLSSFSGDVVYIAFRHHNVTDQDFISIDDVKVTASILSVNDFEIYNFKYAFNNSTKDLNLAADNNLSEVQVIDMLGRTIITQDINATNASINLASLTSSVYLVSVEIEGNTSTFKIAVK